MNMLWRWLARLGHLLRVLFNSISRVIYVVLITVLALLLWLVFTTSGAQWVAERAMAEEERLSLDVTGGSLWNGLELEAVHWSDDGVSVTVEGAELRWNHLCLLRARVCLDLASVRGLDAWVDTEAVPAVADDEQTDADAGADAAGGNPLPLPVDIAFPDVRVQQADITVNGHRARWSDLRLGGALEGRTLKLARFNWETILVELVEGEDDPAVEPTPAEPGPGFLEAGWDALELPEVALPLDVDVEDLRLHELRVMRGEELLTINRLSLNGEMRDSRARLRQLEVVHPQGRLQADGTLTMTGDWPVDLQLQAEATDVPDIGDLRLEAALWNSIADLEFQLRGSGPAEVALEGTAAPGRDQLPMDIRLQWDRLGWPLDTGTLVDARDGRLAVQGNLEDYELDLQAVIQGENIPEGRWQALARGDLQSARLERLRGELLDGWLEVTGTAAWHPQIEWDANVRMQGLAAERIVAQAPSDVGGELRTRGRLTDGDLDLDVQVDALRATLEGHELVLSGGVSRSPGEEWVLRDILLRTGDSALRVGGRVGDEQLDLEGSVAVTDLSAFLADATGQVHGDFTARGALAAPDITANLDGSGFSYGDVASIGALTLEADVAALGEQASRVRLGVRDLEAAEETVDRVDLLLEGSRADHSLTLDVDSSRGGASLAVAGALSEAFDWDGRLERAELTALDQALELQAPTDIRFDAADLQARIGAHCWRHQDATLCAESPITAGATGEAGVALRGLDLAWLAPWLPGGVELDGMVEADLHARWGDTPLPLVTLDTRVDDGQIRIVEDDDMMADDDEPDLLLDYQHLGLRFELDEEGLQTALALRSEDLGTIDINAGADLVNDAQGLGPLAGDVEVQAVQLGILEPFFPELRTLRGTLSAQGRLAGEVTDPRYYGTVALSDGRVEPVAVGMDLTDVDIEVLVDGDSATLSGGFRSGDGTATLSGEADWADALAASLNLSGRGLQVVYDPLADLQVNPDIDVSFADNTLSLGGEIRVPRGDITIAQLPASAVSVSGDVVIIDDEPEPAERDDLEPPDDLPGAPEGMSLETDIQLVLGDRVELTGYGLRGRLTGDLRLTQSGADPPQGTGEIRIVDGEYRAYGQRLRIRQGQLLFSGPLDRPQLYVEAVRRIERDDVTAGLRLEGSPEEPRVSLFSEPAMGEEDVLSYIILGRPMGQGADDDNMLARAAVGLGVAGVGDPATALAEEIGIEDFTIDVEGEADDAQVVVGGYIHPNLYLGYGVGVFTPVNTLTLRYRLATNLYLEAVSSLENAIDLLYRFEFG